MNTTFPQQGKKMQALSRDDANIRLQLVVPITIIGKLGEKKYFHSKLILYYD